MKITHAMRRKMLGKNSRKARECQRWIEDMGIWVYRFWLDLYARQQAYVPSVFGTALADLTECGVYED